jgi:hypothetical protein
MSTQSSRTSSTIRQWRSYVWYSTTTSCENTREARCRIGARQWFCAFSGSIKGLQPHLVLAQVYVQNNHGVAFSNRGNFAYQLLGLSRNGGVSGGGANQQTPFQ